MAVGYNIYIHTNTEPARTAQVQDGINQKRIFMTIYTLCLGLSKFDAESLWCVSPRGHIHGSRAATPGILHMGG
jgi:hypothetical protein